MTGPKPIARVFHERALAHLVQTPAGASALESFERNLSDDQAAEICERAIGVPLTTADGARLYIVKVERRPFAGETLVDVVQTKPSTLAGGAQTLDRISATLGAVDLVRALRAARAL